MASRGNAEGNLFQIHRSLALTDYALGVLDATGERPNRLGPPVRLRCRNCNRVLARCRCLAEKLARQAVA